MAVGFKIDNIICEVGSASFLHSFFSTITGRLEPEGKGSKFPILMNKLQAGKLDRTDAQAALTELDQITSELKDFPPNAVIWDIDDVTKLPPWGNNIADTITDMSNYFVTSTGRDLISLLRELLLELRDYGGTINIADY